MDQFERAGETSSDVAERAQALYRDALVWDSHSGFMPDPVADLANLQRWRDAGVTYLSIDVGFDLLPWEHTLRTLSAFRHWILARPQEFTLAQSIKDIRAAKAAGRMAVTFDIEGMNAFDGRLEMVELYHALGVRQALFAYNRNNKAGGGCHDDNSGLTDFGRAVIDEMNRVGMVVDVTHCSHRTSLEAIEHSKAPVIFSHSNPRVLCDHERNIWDDQIEACAKSGGVVGAVGISLFLGDNQVRSERLADHVEYLLERAGPEHVGIGLDYAFPVEVEGLDGIIKANPQFWPPDRGYRNVSVDYVKPSQLPEVAEILLRRGHAEKVVRGVLGENFLRVAEQVWK